VASLASCDPAGRESRAVTVQVLPLSNTTLLQLALTGKCSQVLQVRDFL